MTVAFCRSTLETPSKSRRRTTAALWWTPSRGFGSATREDEIEQVPSGRWPRWMCLVAEDRLASILIAEIRAVLGSEGVTSNTILSAGTWRR